MGHPTEAPPESEAPLFDVVVKVPPNTKLEDIERRALDDAGVAPDRVASLIKVLRSVPEAKIGAAVSQERADKARAQFTKAGLIVQITPVLALQSLVTGSLDNTIICPACQKRILLPDNRQCPSCGVFVDKLTDEFLLKRKLMDAERARIESLLARDTQNSERKTRQALEAALRAKIREELEKEYGIGKSGWMFSGRPGLIRAGALAGLVGIAFVGGNMSPTVGLWGAKGGAQAQTAAKGAANADVDRMLGSIGPAGAGAGAGTEGTTGDPDIDDPLIQAAGGKRIGAKGISVEQAVAAAQTLAKAAGNTTAGRAMGAGGSAGVGGPAGQSDEAVSTASVPKQTRLVLTAEFARGLAEMGQGPRAREIIKTLKASPDLASQPGAAGAVRIADLEVRAWAMQSFAEGRARQAADAIKTDAMALADPGERARALSNVALILSRNPQLPPDAARAFLTLAAEALKSIGDAKQRTDAASDWAVTLGEVLLAEVNARAKAGMWAKANAAAAQVEALVKEAPDTSSQARLYAIDYQVKQQIGQQDKAGKSLDAALSLAATQSSLAQRATWLRSVAYLSGAAASERMQTAVSALQALAESKTGLEKAQTMAQLSLLHADAGLRPKADSLARLAQSASGLSPADSVAVNSDLIVRGDLATARSMHGLGLYAEAEVLLQRVGGYLL